MEYVIVTVNLLMLLALLIVYVGETKNINENLVNLIMAKKLNEWLNMEEKTTAF